MQKESWFQTFQGDDLLPVHIEFPKGVGIETSLVIRSLQAAFEACVRADEKSRIESPSPALVK